MYGNIIIYHLSSKKKKICDDQTHRTASSNDGALFRFDTLHEDPNIRIKEISILEDYIITFLNGLQSHSSLEEINFEENDNDDDDDVDDEFIFEGDVSNVIVPSVRKLYFSTIKS